MPAYTIVLKILRIPYEAVLGAGVTALYLWISALVRTPQVVAPYDRIPISSFFDPKVGATVVFLAVTGVYLIDANQDANTSDSTDSRKATPEQTQSRTTLGTHLSSQGSSLLAYLLLVTGAGIMMTRSPATVIAGLPAAALYFGLYARKDKWNLWKRFGLKAHAVSAGLVFFLFVITALFTNIHPSAQPISTSESSAPISNTISLWCLVYVLLYLNASMGDVRDVIDDRRTSIPTLPTYTGQNMGLLFIFLVAGTLGCVLLFAGSIPLPATQGSLHPWAQAQGARALAAGFIWTSFSAATINLVLLSKKIASWMFNISDLALFLPLLIQMLEQI
jgi:4-hydroxybenzoate polyprenyltransferase